MKVQGPDRFDYRFIRTLLKSRGCNDPTEDDLDLISRIFTKAGGSWESVVSGDPDTIVFLKTLVKTAIKKGLIDKR